jgi:hypothetical protein
LRFWNDWSRQRFGRFSNANSNRNSNANGYRHTCIDAKCHRNGNAKFDANAEWHTNGHAKCHGFGDANANAEGNSNQAITTASSDTPASAIAGRTFRLRGSSTNGKPASLDAGR